MRQQDVDPDALRTIAEQVLPGSGRPVVVRTPAGISTPVYRIARGGITLYLRLAENPTDYLAPEARVHDLLRALGVRVPDIVHVEELNPLLGRSLMVTTEIPGRPLAEHHGGDIDAAVVRAAGHDLAIINGIAVEGFGWVRRNRPDAAQLVGELPKLRPFALGEIEAHLADVTAFLVDEEIRAVRDAITRWHALLDADRGSLAHGDFDPTHIYHRDGVYTGIIDFGEIRGTDRFYDLGHFALHDGERISRTLLPPLLMGYDEVFSLPADHEHRIRFWSVLIGVRALARNASRPQPGFQRCLTKAVRRALATLTL